MLSIIVGCIAAVVIIVLAGEKLYRHMQQRKRMADTAVFAAMAVASEPAVVTAATQAMLAMMKDLPVRVRVLEVEIAALQRMTKANNDHH